MARGIQNQVNRNYQARGGVQVYSPTRTLIRPSGGMANAGTAQQIMGGGGGYQPQQQQTTTIPRIRVPGIPGSTPAFQYQTPEPMMTPGMPTGGSYLEQLLARAPQQEPQMPGGWRGVLGTAVNNPVGKVLVGALDLLDRPRRAVISTLKEAIDFSGFVDLDPNSDVQEEASWADWWDQFQDPTFGFGSISGNLTNNRWLNRVIGLAGDIALDPLTYVAGAGVITGTGRAARLTGGSRALAAGLGEDVAGQITRYGYAHLDDATRATLRNTAGDTIRDAGWYFKFPFLGDYHRIPGTGWADRTVGGAFGAARAKLAGNRTISRMAFWRSEDGLEAAVQRAIAGRGDMPLSEALDLINLNRAEKLASRSYLQGLEATSAQYQRDFKNAELSRMIATSEAAGGTPAHAYFAFAGDLAEKGGVKFPNGRRHNYIPHFLEPSPREWLAGADPDAVAFHAALGMPNTLDDVATVLHTRQFVPRLDDAGNVIPYNIKGREFWIRPGDGITQINAEWARVFPEQAAKLGKLLDDNFSSIAARYAHSMSESVGMVSAAAALVRSKSGLVTNATDHAVRREVVDEALMKYADEAVADQLKTEQELQSSLVQKLRADTFSDITDARGVLNVHLREALDEVATLEPAKQAEIDSLLESLGTAQGLRNYTPEERARTGASNQLEETLNQVFRDTEATMLDLERQIATVQRQAMIEQHAYREAIRLGRLERRLNNIPERFAALREWNQLVLKRAQMRNDHEIISALRERARLHGLKADIIDRNLENDSFLNLAAGTPQERVQGPREGYERIEGPNGRSYDIPKEPSPGARYEVTDHGVVFRVTDEEYWGPTIAEARIRAEYSDRRARALNPTNEPVMSDMSARVTSMELEVAELQRIKDQVQMIQAPHIEAARDEVELLRVKERTLAESIDDLQGYPGRQEERDNLIDELTLYQSDEGELGQAVGRYQSHRMPVQQAESNVEYTQRKLDALKQQQEELYRDLVAKRGVEPSPEEMVVHETKEMRTLLNERTRIIDEMGRIRRNLERAAQPTEVGKRPLTTSRQRARLSELDTRLKAVDSAIYQARARAREVGPVRDVSQWPQTPGGMDPVQIDRLRRERAALYEQRGRAAGPGGRRQRLAEIAAEEYRVANQEVADAENFIGRTMQEGGLFEMRGGKIVPRNRKVQQIIEAVEKRRTIPDTPRYTKARTRRDAEIAQLMREAGLEGSSVTPEAIMVQRSILEEERVRLVAARVRRSNAQLRFEKRAGRLPQIDRRLNEIEALLDAETRTAVPWDATQVERTIANLNAEEAAAVKQAQELRPEGMQQVYSSVPAKPARPVAAGRTRLLDQDINSTMGRVGVYTADDREALEVAYRIVNNARKVGIATSDNVTYQEALKAIKEIEAAVSSGIPTYRLNEAAPLDEIQRNIELINEARTPMRTPQPGEPGYNAVMGKVGDIDTRGGDVTRIGRSKNAKTVAQTLSERIGADLVDLNAMLPGDLAVVDQLVERMDDLLNQYAKYPMPFLLDQIDQTRADLLRWSDVMNRYWGALEEGLAPSEGLGALITRQVLFKERRAIDNEILELRQVTQLDPRGLIAYEGRVHQLDKRVRDADEYLLNEQRYFELHGKYMDEQERTRAMNRKRENARKLRLLREQGPPDKGALSEYVDGLVNFWYEQVHAVDTAITDWNEARHVTARMNQPAIERAKLEATIPRLEGEIEIGAAANRRLDRAIKVAENRGTDRVRYSPYRLSEGGEAAKLTIEEAEELLPRVPPAFRADLERRIREARVVRGKKVEAVGQPQVRIKFQVPGRKHTTEMSLDELEVALSRGRIPVKMREELRGKLERARAQQKAMLDKQAKAGEAGMVYWRVPGQGQVTEIDIESARQMLAANQKAYINRQLHLENERIRLSILDGSADQEVSNITELIEDQIFLRRMQQGGVTDPRQGGRLKKIERELRDIDRHASRRQPPSLTDLENTRKRHLSARLLALQEKPLDQGQWSQLLDRRYRLRKSLREYQELNNLDFEYMRAAADNAESFLRRVTYGENPSLPRQELGTEIPQLTGATDPRGGLYGRGLTYHDLETLKHFLTAEGGEVAAMFIDHVNRFIADSGGRITQRAMNQFIDGMREALGDTELGERIMLAMMDAMRLGEGDAVSRSIGIGAAPMPEVLSDVPGAGFAEGVAEDVTERVISGEVIRKELFNAMTAAANSIKQMRMREFGQMWDDMGFQLTSIPGLEARLLASGRELPEGYVIKGRSIRDAAGEEIGRVMHSSGESKMGAVGYKMSTQTWDAKEAANFILQQFREKLNYTPESAVSQRITALEMRKQRVTTMLRGLGSTTRFPRLRDPEKFFAWLEGLDEVITEEAADLGRVAREFYEQILPTDQLDQLDAHIGNLYKDFERAMEDGNDELAAQINARIDRLTAGERPVTEVGGIQVADEVAEPTATPPSELTAEADEAVAAADPAIRREAEANVVNAQEHLEAANNRLREIDQRSEGTADSFSRMIADEEKPPNPWNSNTREGQSTAAERFQHQYEVQEPFEREHYDALQSGELPPELVSRYQEMIDLGTDMRANRWVEEPEGQVARARAHADRYDEMTEKSGFRWAEMADYSDDLGQERAAAQSAVKDAQDQLREANEALARLGDEAEPSAFDERSAAELDEGDVPQPAEPRPTEPAPGDEHSITISDNELGLQQIEQEYEDVTAEFNELISGGIDALEPDAADRAYELLARARRLEELRESKLGTVQERVLRDRSEAYRKYMERAGEKRRPEVGYSWHDVMRPGAISHRTMPLKTELEQQFGQAAVAGAPQRRVAGGKLGSTILAMSGLPIGRGRMRNSLDIRLLPFEKPLRQVEQLREGLAGTAVAARGEQQRLLGEVAEHEGQLAGIEARIGELEPKIRPDADVSDVQEAAARAERLRADEQQRLTTERNAQITERFRARAEYNAAIQRTDALIASLHLQLNDAVATHREMNRNLTLLQRGLEGDLSDQAADWGPLLFDMRELAKMARTAGIAPRTLPPPGGGFLPPTGAAAVDPAEIDALEAVLTNAYDGMRSVLRAERDAADLDATINRRLRDWGKGAHLTGDVFMQVLRDGWTPIAEKLMGGDVGKGIRRIGFNEGDLAPDAIVMADGLATAWNNLRAASRRPDSWKMVDKYTAFFKTYATAKPGFHVRNAISAVFMNLVDGVRMRHLSGALPIWREMRQNPEKFFATTGERILNEQTGATLNDALHVVWASGAGGPFEEHGIGGAITVGSKAYKRLMNNVITRWNRRAGGFVEGTARLAMAMDGLAKGMSVEAALERVIKFHFDYLSMSKLDRSARRFIPFWTFMSRNIPLQLEQMFLRPRMYQMYRAVVRNFGQPVDPATPEYWLSQGAWTLDEMAQDREAPWYLAPDLPHLRVTEPFDAMARGQWGKALFSDMNPLGLAPVEAFAFNQKAYTGAPIEENYRPPTPAMTPLMPIFKLLGGTAEGGTSGDQLLDDRYAHVARSINPVLDFIERLTDQSGTRAGRQDETLYRALGLPVYQLTPELRRSTRARQYYETRDEFDTQAELARS